MKITFIEDHQSLLSGHSFYKAGTRADLVKGQQLIDGGFAYEGWENPAPSVPPLVEVVESIDIDFNSMSTDDLKAHVKAIGINPGRMKRSTLLKRLENDGN